MSTVQRFRSMFSIYYCSNCTLIQIYIVIGEVRVEIQVLDFNDCPPEFVNPLPSMEVAEETVGVGSIVTQFEIDDCDSGLNGRNGTRFSIIAGEFKTCYKVSLLVIVNDSFMYTIFSCPWI